MFVAESSVKSCSLLSINSNPVCCDLFNESPWRVILLSGGQTNHVAIVEEGDYEHLIKWNWRLRQFEGRVVAYRRSRCVDEKAKDVFMHHEVARMHGEKWRKIRHLNGFSLDNRFSNLDSYKSCLPYSPQNPGSRKRTGTIDIYLSSFKRRRDRGFSDFKNNEDTAANAQGAAEAILEQSWKEINFLKGQRLKTAFMLTELLELLNRINLDLIDFDSTRWPLSEQPLASHYSSELKSIGLSLENVLKYLQPKC